MHASVGVFVWHRDCWCVAFGNSYNDEERCVLAGYDNGDVKMFDLRTNKVVGRKLIRKGFEIMINITWTFVQRSVRILQ